MSTKQSPSARDAEQATLTLEFGLDTSAVPKALAERFLELKLDAANEQFIDAALAAPHGAFLTWLHDFACRLAADFEVNGVLNMYPVHLLSVQQWEQFLPAEVAPALHLDVGAGNGNLTQALRPRCGETVVTEASWAMRRRLRAQGFRTYPPNLRALKEHGRFGLVTCLNVLDRTAYPLSLLAELSAAAQPLGWLTVAVPLPLNPFYYSGPFTFAPRQPLSAPGPSWEQALRQLLACVTPALPGWELVRFTRAPYLSWGDAGCSLYALDDAVLLFRHTGESAKP